MFHGRDRRQTSLFAVLNLRGSAVSPLVKRARNSEYEFTKAAIIKIIVLLPNWEHEVA
jgi:hypothetical protein